ncbi:MAG: malto-oligosyltrehalose trehalohydrolase [Cyanobacteriota bacterium]|nr:malto-oligosyltrehalose trehalohydrolase [Cyanobacteriota bacterium]
MKVGSHYLAEKKQCQFTVWAPLREKLAVHIVHPQEKLIELQKDEWGYWQGEAKDIDPETLYFYQLDGETDRPDPASHWQPQGVHGPSKIVDHQQFTWNDTSWQGIPLAEMIIYELHVGTFTQEGTFTAIIPKLPDLKDLGVNVIEIMPVAQFPGDRNWGYDGVDLYSVQNSYGSPDGLKQLVNACHQAGIAVILDVVYNHFGPEGNYLWDYGPYFTDKYNTPWGNAVNFDDAYSNEVRNFFIENTLYWLDKYHIDGLRLDAIHAIYDMSAEPFLQQLADRVEEFSKNGSWKRYLIAESDLNDVRVLRSKENGGFGHDAQWCDDFHHSLHTLLTGETSGYYCDFSSIEYLKKSYKQGYVYTGEYSSIRQRNHGNSPLGLAAEKFVVCIQNHDQIGNRLIGERLSALVDFEGLKLAAGAVLISPFVPMLFMGEEYGEENPFMYFVSHGDPNLVEAVRKGRAEEFKSFNWSEEVPDPQGEKVFMDSKLNWEKSREGKYGVLRSFYKRLIELRKKIPVLAELDTTQIEVQSLADKNVLLLHRWGEKSSVLSLMNFEKQSVTFEPQLPTGNWQKLINSSDREWMGEGAVLPEKLLSGQTVTINPLTFALYQA